MKFKSLKDKVVIITGASSGIGKLAVEAFFKEGAKVVLAARSEDAMYEHLMEMGIHEDDALVVKTDVSDYEQMQNLVNKTMEKFGQIDVFINNAGVIMYGTAEETEVEDIRKLIDTNLMGQIHGCKAVLPIFKKQGYGNIQNVASIFGKITAPYVSAYSATKFGLVGYTKSLREELMPFKDICATTICPASMDTPISMNGQSYFKEEPLLMPPIHDPMITVDAMVKAAKNPKYEVLVGPLPSMMVRLSGVAPNFVEKVMSFLGYRTQKSILPNRHSSALEGASKHHGGRGEFGTTTQYFAKVAQKYPVQTAVGVGIPLISGLILLALLGRRKGMA